MPQLPYALHISAALITNKSKWPKAQRKICILNKEVTNKNVIKEGKKGMKRNHASPKIKKRKKRNAKRAESISQDQEYSGYKSVFRGKGVEH